MKEALTLYHTAGCHLCEEAEQLLQQVLNPDFFSWTLVDIVESDELVERYGVRIPVLLRNASSAELGWPFGVEELIEFLSA